jgi:prepilin-type N-terminal cleavage/methylation domain-containing protein
MAKPRTRRAERSEAGVTLIELMVTISILGIAFTALLASLMGVFSFGEQHRKLAVGETLVRRYADSVNNATYVDCATTSSYSASLTPAPPTGYTVTITTVEYWNGDASATFGTSQSGCVSASDKGAQRITVRVTGVASVGPLSNDVVILKRDPS